MWLQENLSQQDLVTHLSVCQSLPSPTLCTSVLSLVPKVVHKQLGFWSLTVLDLNLCEPWFPLCEIRIRGPASHGKPARHMLLVGV